MMTQLIRHVYKTSPNNIKVQPLNERYKTTHPKVCDLLLFLISMIISTSSVLQVILLFQEEMLIVKSSVRSRMNQMCPRVIVDNSIDTTITCWYSYFWIRVITHRTLKRKHQIKYSKHIFLKHSLDSGRDLNQSL